MPEHPVAARTRRFLEWELRGRGWLSWPFTVEVEPPFQPFIGHSTLLIAQIDDGRRETWLSRLFSWSQKETGLEEAQDATDTPPVPFTWGSRPTEFRLRLPEEGIPAVTETWLSTLGSFDYPLALELVGERGQVEYRLAGEESELRHAIGVLSGLAPGLEVEEAVPLPILWGRGGQYGLIQELALAREFMIPLDASPQALQGLVAALSGVRDGLAIVQVLVSPVRQPWGASILRSVQTSTGEPFFRDAPEITAAARQKCSSPLRAVCLRLALSADSHRALGELLKGIGGVLLSIGSPAGNTLVPLMVDEEIDLEGDLLERTTHRSGMILSIAELLPLVGLENLPESVPGLAASLEPDLPDVLRGPGVVLGNDAEGEEARIGLEERLRHMHLVGATGTGKSNLLLSLILQDIAAGRAVAVIDPHGELVWDVISNLPADALSRTTLLDPGQEDGAVGWNMLEASSEEAAERLAGDLVGTFKRLATSWGDQMTAVLSNAILALLDAGGGTLLDLRRFLVDRDTRQEILSRVRDPYRRSFWREEFPMLAGGKSIGPILTRLDAFLRFGSLRRLVASQGGGVDFQEILDGRVLLCPLSIGTFGRENASLLGSLLVGALSQAAFARSSRNSAFIYLDECHEVATPSLAQLLSGARKFGVGLVLAHQDLHQLRGAVPEIERSVLGNAHTRIAFRVGEEDARRLAGGFAHFQAEDLIALGVGEAIGRVGGATQDFRLRTRLVENAPDEIRRSREEKLRQLMDERFPRVPVELTPEPAGQEQPLESEPSVEVTPVRQARPVMEEKGEPEPPTPGRGGAEHQYLQALVKRLGESVGFRATIEAPAGEGQVDVALEREDRRLGVEIAVTTTPEHELANIRKCLAAFDEVLVVTASTMVRRKLGEHLAELPEKEQERVELLSPEEASSYILSLPLPEEKMVKGYKVRRRYRAAEGADAKARQETVARIIAERMGKLGKSRED